MEILFTSLAFGLGFGAGALSFIGLAFVLNIKEKQKRPAGTTEGMTIEQANLLIQQDSYHRHGIFGFEAVQKEHLAQARTVILTHIAEMLEREK